MQYSEHQAEIFTPPQGFSNKTPKLYIVFKMIFCVNLFNIVGCHTFDQVLNTAKVIRRKLPDLLSSLEMLDNEAADTLRDNLNLTVPISKHPFYVLVEISG